MHYVLWISSVKSNIEFKTVSFPVGPIEVSNPWKASGIVQSERCHLLPGQYQSSCLFVEPAEIGIAWLGCPNTHAEFTQHFSFGYPQISIPRKKGRTSIFWKPNNNHLDRFITQKDTKFSYELVFRPNIYWSFCSDFQTYAMELINWFRFISSSTSNLVLDLTKLSKTLLHEIHFLHENVHYSLWGLKRWFSRKCLSLAANITTVSLSMEASLLCPQDSLHSRTLNLKSALLPIQMDHHWSQSELKVKKEEFLTNQFPMLEVKPKILTDIKKCIFQLKSHLRRCPHRSLFTDN